MKNKKTEPAYNGFEQGPIRPPSEANSILFRLTRNCPWNRCTFCSVYKDDKFSLRPVDHIIKDIDMVYQFTRAIKENKPLKKIAPMESGAFFAAKQWIASGMESIFLQDANSLIMKPAHLIQILEHIKNRFPQVKRITSYARSHTVAKISDENLKQMADAGLNRLHLGLETGSDEILKMVKKGTSKDAQIRAGIKTKKAGIQLSEYVLTGIGGHHFSKAHAIETADVLNRINPDFIRFRTLHIPETLDHFQEPGRAPYERSTDLVLARELLFLIENLENITSHVKSDHMLNLFEEVDGELPRDKEKIMAVLKTFINMDPLKQAYFQIGKRLQIFHHLRDLDDPHKIAQVEKICRDENITPETVDDVIHHMVQEYIKMGMSG
jgi:radical SAM superfamily enzyme YgiQ (UPF0313 family)